MDGNPEQKVASGLSRLANRDEFDALRLAEIPAVPLLLWVVPVLMNSQAFETGRAGSVIGIVECAGGRAVRQGRFVQIVVGARHVRVIVPFSPEEIERHGIDGDRVLGSKEARSPVAVEGSLQELARSVLGGMHARE